MNPNPARNLRKGLRSHNREQFAQLIAAGHSNADAYMATYGRTSKATHRTIVECASRMRHRADVAARIAELEAAARAVAAERLALDKEGVLRRLVEVVDRCMQAEPVLNRRGEPTGMYTFNAAGANRALELIGKNLGMFVERSEVKTTALTELSDEDLQRMISKLRADNGISDDGEPVTH